MQPLLRDAGRDRVLERLTRAERDAAEQRADDGAVPPGLLRRYVVTGGNPASGPNRAGGQFGGAGLEGFTGVGAGGFGRSAAAAVARRARRRPRRWRQQAGNYLGLLQAQREIRNQEDNVRRLRRNLSRLTTLLERAAGAGHRRLSSRRACKSPRPARRCSTPKARCSTTAIDFQANLDTFKVNDPRPAAADLHRAGRHASSISSS